MNGNNPQERLRIYVAARAQKLRVTNVAMAAAINRDEITVRRLLSPHTDCRIDLERHLIPWQDLLDLDDDELGQVWLQAHGLRVQVSLDSDALVDDETPTIIRTAELARSTADLQGKVAAVSAAGVASTAQVAEVSEMAAKTARLARHVGGRVAAKVVGRPR